MPKKRPRSATYRPGAPKERTGASGAPQGAPRKLGEARLKISKFALASWDTLQIHQIDRFRHTFWSRSSIPCLGPPWA